MHALAWRQIVAAMRMPALWIATAIQVVALALYLLVWGDGIPVVGARSPFDQFAAAQSVLLLMVLPWVAARCAATPHRDAVARMAVLSARDASTVILGACLGLMGVVCAVAIAGLPLAIVSQQIADREPIELVATQLRVVALGACAGSLTLAAMLVSGSRLGGWLIATAAASSVVWAAPGGLAGGLALASVAACAVAAVAHQGGQTWRHRLERRV